MKTDYRNLRGTEVKAIRSDGSEKLLYVIGADYHQGITLVDENSRERFCLNREIHAERYGKSAYRRAFHFMIKAIQVGEYHADSIFPIIGGNPSGANLSCAFR